MTATTPIGCPWRFEKQVLPFFSEKLEGTLTDEQAPVRAFGAARIRRRLAGPVLAGEAPAGRSARVLAQVDSRCGAPTMVMPTAQAKFVRETFAATWRGARRPVRPL